MKITIDLKFYPFGLSKKKAKEVVIDFYSSYTKNNLAKDLKDYNLIPKSARINNVLVK